MALRINNLVFKRREFYRDVTGVWTRAIDGPVTPVQGVSTYDLAFFSESEEKNLKDGQDIKKLFLELIKLISTVNDPAYHLLNRETQPC
jgi:hypothetical protein